MKRFKSISIGTAAVALLLGGAAQAAPVTFPVSYRAYSHPNGEASANMNAVDNRDYGLRLDNGQGVQTFHFLEDVVITFYKPVAPDNSTVMARLTGTLAHLQSSNGAVVGYAAGSGYDALDQRYAMTATFRVEGAAGGWNGANAVPYSLMFDDLIAGGVNAANKITFSLADLALTELFGGPKVFTGALNWDEFPGSEAAPASSMELEYRHRLAPGTFAGPAWDVIGANGWLEPAIDGGRGFTNDFLFYIDRNPVPEPSSLALLALGALPLLRRRAV